MVIATDYGLNLIKAFRDLQQNALRESSAKQRCWESHK